MDAGAIILAGGLSSRMGTNKAFLNVGGETNIERIRNILQLEFRDLLLVTNQMEEYQYLNLPMVSDLYPGKGPLAGIHAGLSVSTQSVNFIVACDMPFISVTLARFLVEQIEDYDIVVPSIGGQLHTLFSVFKKSAAPVIKESIKNNKFRIQDVFKALKVKIITEEELKITNEDLSVAFFNMNTIEDYEQVKRIIRINSNMVG